MPWGESLVRGLAALAALFLAEEEPGRDGGEGELDRAAQTRARGLARGGAVLRRVHGVARDEGRDGVSLGVVARRVAPAHVAVIVGHGAVRRHDRAGPHDDREPGDW